MDKKQAQEITNDVLMADALIKLKSLEILLINKGVFTEDEFKNKMKETTELITNSILSKIKA